MPFVKMIFFGKRDDEKYKSKCKLLFTNHRLFIALI